MRWILGLFVVVPLVEFTLLVLIGDALGLEATLLLIVTTGLLGGALARREGLSVWRQWQHEIASLQAPGLTTAQGLLVLVGGILLVTPGVLTDLVGLACVLPPSRRTLARRLLARFSDRVVPAPRAAEWVPNRSDEPRVIETTGRSIGDR